MQIDIQKCLKMMRLSSQEKNPRSNKLIQTTIIKITKSKITAMVSKTKIKSMIMEIIVTTTITIIIKKTTIIMITKMPLQIITITKTSTTITTTITMIITNKTITRVAVMIIMIMTMEIKLSLKIKIPIATTKQVMTENQKLRLKQKKRNTMMIITITPIKRHFLIRGKISSNKMITRIIMHHKARRMITITKIMIKTSKTMTTVIKQRLKKLTILDNTINTAT